MVVILSVQARQGVGGSKACGAFGTTQREAERILERLEFTGGRQ